MQKKFSIIFYDLLPLGGPQRPNDGFKRVGCVVVVEKHAERHLVAASRHWGERERERESRRERERKREKIERRIEGLV